MKIVRQGWPMRWSQQDVIAFARTRLAGFRMPKQLVVVETVQRAANGKVDYKPAKAIAMEKT